MAWCFGLALTGAGCQSRAIEVPAFPDSFVGVGVELRMDGETPVVVRALVGSPSADAGVLPGDHITSIDDRPTAGETFGTIVMRLRGAPGSRVRLELSREGSTRSLSVQRHRIERRSQDYRAD